MNSIQSLILPPLSTIYNLVTRARTVLYSKGTFKAHKLAVPVISVGNITTGGTGKTPLVEWICRALAKEGANVCVLTRGYGRENPQMRVLVSDGSNILVNERQAGDEPLLLAEKLKGLAAVISDADRVAAGRWAIDQLGAEIFVLDDGFQHLRLARDLDIVAIDATNPWGNGHLLPYGRLREPISGLKRADCLVITRAEESRRVITLKESLETISRQRPVFVSQMRPVCLTTMSGQEVSGEMLTQPLGAFCAVGNPDSFFSQIERLGISCVFKKAWPDHYRYSHGDVGLLMDEAAGAGAKGLITTAKDAVKLRSYSFPLPCYVLEIQISIDRREEFLQMVLKTLVQKNQEKRTLSQNH